MSKMTNPVGEPSVSCGFFNSKGDRKYDALQFSSLFDGLINDGIFSSIGMCMVVNATDTNVVKVGTGKAWFNKTWTQNDAVLSIDCGASDQLYERVDAIVIEVNTTANVRDNFIKLIKGTPGTPAANPAMTKSNGVYQYPLCYIKRAAGSTKITQAEIVNMVGSPETPFVTGVLEHVDLDTLLGQWRSQLNQFIEGREKTFDDWFNTIKGILGENGANAATLGGRDISGFMQHYYHPELNINVVKDPCYKYPYIGDFIDNNDDLGFGSQQWYHVIHNPHYKYSAGYSGQILIPFNDNRILIRTSTGKKWSKFYDYKAEIENLKSIAVNFKTRVANVINSLLSTKLSNQSPNDTIINAMSQLRGKLAVDADRHTEDIVNAPWTGGDDTFDFKNITVLYVQLEMSGSNGVGGEIWIKASKKAVLLRLGNGESNQVIDANTFECVACYKPSTINFGYGYGVIICEEPADVSVYGYNGLLTIKPII